MSKGTSDSIIGDAKSKKETKSSVISYLLDEKVFLVTGLWSEVLLQENSTNQRIDLQVLIENIYVEDTVLLEYLTVIIRIVWTSEAVESSN